MDSEDMPADIFTKPLPSISFLVIVTSLVFLFLYLSLFLFSFIPSWWGVLTLGSGRHPLCVVIMCLVRLYTSLYPIISMVFKLDFYFGASFRRNYPDFLSRMASGEVFVQYCGLRGARRVLLNEDGGAFTVISRVWHQPSDEMWVMKRTAFDKTGLAEYLGGIEIKTLEAMKGNIWFLPHWCRY